MASVVINTRFNNCGGDGVQLHCAAGGVLYRAHNLRQLRSSQGYERRRIGGGQRGEEGQGRQR